MSEKNWSNRLSFIITTSAFAVGVGNIWRFPYITGEGGGGAFLLVYLALVLLIGIPIMAIEMGLGRMSRHTPLIGFGILSKKPAWNFIGWLEILANLLIMCFYIMIMSWIVIYLWESATGRLTSLDPTEMSSHFDAVTSNLSLVILINLAIMVAAVLIVSRGLHVGLERYSKWMLTALVIMLFALAIWSATLDGAVEGYKWFLFPDFSKLNFQVVVSAMGQLFFSLGIGMGVAFTFGSYTSDEENLIVSATWIVLADTFFAILAGLMLFPAIFTFGLAPDSGPNLIFITMATVFGKLELGQLLGASFFVLLFLAGFTSLITSLQGLKDSFSERFNISGNKSLFLMAILICIGSIPVVFSYTETPVRLFGNTIFETLDYLTNIVMLPLAGLLIVLFSGYVVGYDRLKTHFLKGAESMKIGIYWKWVIQIIIPLALLIILINGLL